MASESAFLGTRSVYINSLPLMCYLKLEQDHGILKHFTSSEGVVDHVKELVSQNGLKQQAMERSAVMKKDFIDPTKFLVWFIENYPESHRIIRDQPDYQLKFK